MCIQLSVTDSQKVDEILVDMVTFTNTLNQMIHCVFLGLNLTVNNWFYLPHKQFLALAILAYGQVHICK